MKTAVGFVGYAAPQVTGGPEAFRSQLRTHLKGRSEALEDLAIEMLARGLSVRDIEDAFKDETGRLFVRGGAPAAQDHSQRLRRKGRAQADVRRHDAGR